MNSSEIKRKIAELIGKSFFSFGSYKTKDGVEMKIHGDKMEIGMPIYVITPEGELPVDEGTYELESGMKVKVKAGEIASIEDELNTNGTPIAEPAGDDDGDGTEMGKTKMDEAKLVDGTIVAAEGPFEVGKMLYVKDEEGEYKIAPSGEHTTDSGIVFVVSDGTITGLRQPGQPAEGSLVDEEMSTTDLVALFTNALTELNGHLASLKQEHSLLKERFEKVAGEPAAERFYDRKGFFEAQEEQKYSKMDALSKLKKLNK